VTSERDLADALKRVSRYVSKRSAESPKVRPLRTEPAQNPHNPAAAEPGPEERAGVNA